MGNFNRGRGNGFGRNRRFGSRFGQKSKPKTQSSLYINKAIVVSEQVCEPIVHSFADFNLSNAIAKRVSERGFTTPTPIQDRCIPLVMSKRDVIGIADTGTGKTAAFLLPLLDKTLKDQNQKTLIIVPTRELASQIEDELRSFSIGMYISSAVCLGGAGYGSQINALRRNPKFIIGTPGRLKDFVNKRMLNLSNFTNLVIDEADRMVDMGFIEDIKFLVSKISASRQSLFFSATITPQVKHLIENFTINAESVTVKKRDTSQNVEQDVVKYTGTAHKISLLHDILIQEDCSKALVFGRTKHGVEKLSTVLAERGFGAVSIHGNKSQPQRQRALKEFKENRAKVLVATDVAARGLDIPDVSHVINYDEPENYSDYIHRIGRTGRANKAGKALTFVGVEG